MKKASLNPIPQRFFLQKVEITNFAIFEHEIIEFSPGLNCLTGETGSGKSLVFDALGAIFSPPSDVKILRSLIRQGSSSFTLKATFYCPQSALGELLKDKAALSDTKNAHELTQLTLTKIISLHEKSKLYANDVKINQETIAQFVQRHIDLTRQFDNQRLLDGSYQLHLLDLFSNVKEDLKTYQELFSEFSFLKENKDQLEKKIQESEGKIELLSFQAKEMEMAEELYLAEEEMILQKNRFMQRQKIQDITQTLSLMLSDNPEQETLLSLTQKMVQVVGKQSTLLTHEFNEELKKIMLSIEILEDELQKSRQDLDDGPKENLLEKIHQLGLYKKKYGMTYEDFQQKRQHVTEELSSYENPQEQLALLEKKMKEKENLLFSLNEKLHHDRLKGATELSKILTTNIAQLNMPHATLTINIEKKEELTFMGGSSVRFNFCPNPGERTDDLRAMASGGELSRILLALRQAFIGQNDISIFLFDEIDTGLDAKTAQVIGQILHTMGQRSQLLVISHLPQVVKFAHQLIVVKKLITSIDSQQRTISQVEHLRSSKEIHQQIQEFFSF